ncbi:MAG TPA: esterase-like activity of phytase family protein, partial [Hyphomicrobiales bacterium]|nr:esterase-like activity of phytase family protein [Hyphomicrobiales bacterium]
DRTRFGALIWRGGLKISGEPPFGGLSGLVLSADGGRLTAVTDQGDWVTGRLDYEGRRPTGLSDVVMTPIEGAPGERLKNKSDKDAEGLTAVGENAFLVSFERRHRIARYARNGKGGLGRAAYLRVPMAIADLPSNRGLEAVGLVPGSDTVAAIAERALDEAGNHSGWLIEPDGGGQRFAISRSDGFDITDLAFLPGGDLVVLERRYGPFLGGAFRLRRVAREDLRPGALIEGRVLFTADDGYTVDNMEGLAVHRGKEGETVLTLVSDDNFSAAQATLLLQFALGRK